MSILPMRCSEKLKVETKEVHRDTEILIVKRLSTINCINDYINLLKLFYGFFAPLEMLTRNYISEEILSDIRQRGNTKKIIEDLTLIGGEKNIVLSSCLPQVTNVLQAFGAMYVSEGSTLGGQIIARMLRENKNIKISNEALSFFEGYKENTVKMWKSLQSHLDNRFQTDEQVREIALTAKETFLTMKEWIIGYL